MSATNAPAAGTRHHWPAMPFHLLANVTISEPLCCNRIAGMLISHCTGSQSPVNRCPAFAEGAPKLPALPDDYHAPVFDRLWTGNR